MSITYRIDAPPDRDAITALYAAVKWSAYTKDLDRLEAAIAASLRVVTAWDGGQLIGLARVVGDGLTIIYLQDILVRPTHQHSGIGRELLTRAFEPYGNVRQKVLITDDDPAQHAFYESMGFTDTVDLEYPIRTFVQLG